jgi:hypothetical protein
MAHKARSRFVATAQHLIPHAGRKAVAAGSRLAIQLRSRVSIARERRRIAASLPVRFDA